MRRRFISPVVLCVLGIACCVGLVACGGRPSPQAHEHEDHPPSAGEGGTAGETGPATPGVAATTLEDPPAGEIAVPLAALTGIAWATVGEPVEEGAWVAAEAVADPGSRVRLAAPVSGVVQALRAEPGQELTAGVPLLEIRSTELAALHARLLAARAENERAAVELAREERLVAVGAAAGRDLDAARAAQRTAAAEEAAARWALEARGLPPEGAGVVAVLRSPRPGRVAAWNVLEGEGVEGGQAVGDFDAGRATLVRVELALPGAPGWVPGSAARVRRADGVEWRARVTGVPESLDAVSRRLTYRLRIVDGEGAERELPLAGTPLEVRVPLARAVVLPQTALQQIEGEWGVFVADGAAARFRPVRRGAELGGDVLVLEGVAAGERVATAGAYLLKSLYLRSAGGGDAHAH